MAAGFEPSLFTLHDSRPIRRVTPGRGRRGVTMIEVEVAQRVRACSNPAMVIDLARSVLVALFWAAGRGADGSAMQVQATKLAFRSRPISS
eukprot:scaffold18041_cov120-Isochrysis_galbana.AAC.1